MGRSLLNAALLGDGCELSSPLRISRHHVIPAVSEFRVLIKRVSRALTDVAIVAERLRGSCAPLYLRRDDCRLL